MHALHLKKKVIRLRKNGKTYGEIKRILGKNLSKSTLSNWCSNVFLTRLQKEKLRMVMSAGSERGRFAARLVLRLKRKEYFRSLKKKIMPIVNVIRNKDVKKIAAAMLYLGEGSKFRRGSLCIGNSSPEIISLFLYLLRNSYNINESKFRCTVQCRADQNIKELEKFWSNVTKIKLSQFYKARIDSRTIGKLSKKLDYKGVCRLDYFSAELFNELMEIGRLVCKMGL